MVQVSFVLLSEHPVPIRDQFRERPRLYMTALTGPIRIEHAGKASPRTRYNHAKL